VTVNKRKISVKNALSSSNKKFKNACAGRNMDLQHGATNMVSSFRVSSAVPPSPVVANNFATHAPQPPPPTAAMTNEQFEHLFNHFY
jgi:hypothetical protein